MGRQKKISNQPILLLRRGLMFIETNVGNKGASPVWGGNRPKPTGDMPLKRSIYKLSGRSFNIVAPN